MESNLSKSREQFREDHISRWSTSELSQVEYCRVNKIGLKSFQYWKRKTKSGGCTTGPWSSLRCENLHRFHFCGPIRSFG